MGFAAVGDEDVVFTDGDIEALRVWKVLVETGTFDPGAEVSAARTHRPGRVPAGRVAGRRR